MKTQPELNPGSAKAIVRLEGISKVYGSGDTQVYALRSVNLSIGAGEYCAIVGASGSGKSTLMNLVGCLDRPSSGEYYLDGQEVAQLADDALAYTRNRKIGFVFQQFHLLPQLSALENVVLPMIYANISPKERQDRAKVALEKEYLAKKSFLFDIEILIKTFTNVLFSKGVSH